MNLLAELINFAREALSHYGGRAQTAKAMEECDELGRALTSWAQAGRPPAGTRGHSEVIDEIADVLIMAHQMRELFGAEAVDERIQFKIDRQRGRMLGDA